ncbi:MAG: hypothetical protein LBD01_05775 [Puniceicoccales bacterium]|jgi:uncharacterized membrane protein|nr:hypothetical protein [Puniceicoccales bacterium]
MKRVQPGIRREKWMGFVRPLARLVLTGVFVVAAIFKLVEMGETQNAVESYSLLPEWAVWPAALFLPWVEFVAGISLWVPWLRAAAQEMIALLLVIFLGAIIAAWARGLDIQCGCFGGTETANYPWLVARDLGLLGLLSLSKKKK